MPNELEAGAVIPQCLDNQYVTGATLAAMIDGALNYEHAQVRALRTTPVRSEFIRSLIYAPQVVVNRAYFRNNEFLYSNYHPRNESELSSFVELMNHGAILAFLGTENSLVDPVAFDTTSDGDLACQALMGRLKDNYTAVKFSKDEVENKRMMGQLGRRFANYFGGLNNLDYASRMEMATELFTDPELLQNEAAETLFHDLIDQLADYAADHARAYQKAERGQAKGASQAAPRPLSRNEIYDRFFIDTTTVDPKKVANGRFLRAHGIEREARFALKKLVDLKYNSNLPDMLGRFTFTPFEMPSRMALQDEFAIGESLDDVDRIISQVTKVKRALIADSQQVMYLPVLQDLTLADVIQIRGLPEWRRFMDVQAQILTDPLGQCGQLDELNRRFADLQVCIAKWYRDHHQLDKIVGRYKVAVTLLLNIGASSISIGLDNWKLIDAIMSGSAPYAIPERSKGVMAKLAFYVIDVTVGRIDRDRSWTLQISRSNEEFERGYFLDCLRRLRETDQGNVTRPDKLADQGKE